MKDTARTVGELAEVVRGRVHGDPHTVIRGIASIEEARSGDITFAESERFLEDAQQSSASAILTSPSVDLAINVSKAFIQVENPRFAFAQLLNIFAPEQFLAREIHPQAVVGNDLRAGANVAIGAGAVIGENVQLGNNVTIYPLAFIGDDCEIGDDTVIYPNTTILRGTIVGARCVLHAGGVYGADGYGFVTVGGVHQKIPQIGHVWIGDDCEIGANVTIDRARTGATRIGNGSKIDNLVHIAHNVQIGEHCLVIAQVGLAGGVSLGDRVVIAGQAGVKEQVKIGAGAVIAGQSGVFGDIAPGAFVSGHPARPHREALKGQAALGKVPDLMSRVKDLEKRLAALEKAAE
ncbi:MAG: UDP-3-O-(3-hydroxymyristoyl)glucosamine N-acyltransferase [Armatimonas sp.]